MLIEKIFQSALDFFSFLILRKLIISLIIVPYSETKIIGFFKTNKTTIVFMWVRELLTMIKCKIFFSYSTISSQVNGPVKQHVQHKEREIVRQSRNHTFAILLCIQNPVSHQSLSINSDDFFFSGYGFKQLFWVLQWKRRKKKKELESTN